MKTKLLLFTLLSFSFYLLSSQVPQGFNYQAIVRDTTGKPIINTPLPVRITIQSDSLGGTKFWIEEHPSVITDSYGLFNIILGKGVKQFGSTANTFYDIDWSVTPKFIKTEIDKDGWRNIGSSRLWTVPYSMVAGDLNDTLKKLIVKGQTDIMDEALFEVKNKNSQTVFAVYNEGVRVYVDNGAKGIKGGFAIGGFNKTKDGINQDYFIVNRDSVRVYLDTLSSKTKKGGFAIGGFNKTKDGNKSFLNVATDATGIINPSQNRLLWYPFKNAFLVGKVLVEMPDSVGENSFTTGYESKATGMYSQAMGYKAIARGNYSTAIGNNAIVNADNSFSFGDGASSLFQNSYSFGRGATAKAEGSFSLGYNSISSGQDSYAIGTGTEASGQGSFAIGFIGRDSAGVATGNTKASGRWAFAMGMGSQATNDGAIAFGTQTKASGPYSMAIGLSSTSTNWNSLAIGQSATANGEGSVSIGRGTVADGLASVSLGSGTYTSNFASTAFGHATSATGYISFASGWGTIASGISSVAMGRDSEASGRVSFSMGDRTVASGDGSVAMGIGSKALTVGAIAIGTDAYSYNGIALGNSAVSIGAGGFAVGYMTRASGENGIAIGCGSIALGDYSVSIGTSTIAKGSGAVAMGGTTTASGSGSTSIGLNTIAKPYVSLVIGQYNDTTLCYSQTEMNVLDPILIIGNGLSTDQRSNALTVYKDGRLALGNIVASEMLDVNGNARLRGLPSGNGDALVADTEGKLFRSASDSSLKYDVKLLTDGLDKVQKLRAVTFNWKGEENKSRSIGLLAQEVERVLPEAVFTNPVDNLKGINYSEITPVLIQAIKEQQQQIESAKQENQQLKSELQLLNEKMEKIEAMLAD